MRTMGNLNTGVAMLPDTPAIIPMLCGPVEQRSVSKKKGSLFPHFYVLWFLNCLRKTRLQLQVALNFVLNYEEGGENCLLHGDNESEKLLSEIVGASAYVGQRHGESVGN